MCFGAFASFGAAREKLGTELTFKPSDQVAALPKIKCEELVMDG